MLAKLNGTSNKNEMNVTLLESVKDDMAYSLKILV